MVLDLNYGTCKGISLPSFHYQIPLRLLMAKPNAHDISLQPMQPAPHSTPYDKHP